MPVNTTTINPLLCMSVKNKKNDLNTQCPFYRKHGEYCGIHARNPQNVIRIDQILTTSIITNNQNSVTFTNTNANVPPVSTTPVTTQPTEPPISTQEAATTLTTTPTTTIIKPTTTPTTTTTTLTTTTTTLTTTPTTNTTPTTTTTTLTTTTMTATTANSIPTGHRIPPKIFPRPKQRPPRSYSYYTYSDLPLPQPQQLSSDEWRKVFESCIHYKINMVGTPDTFLTALINFLQTSIINDSGEDNPGINLFKYPENPPSSVSNNANFDVEMIKKCCNDEDFYVMNSLSEIPSSYLFFFSLGDTIWGTDIRSLHDYFQANPDNTPRNPYTNQPFPATDFDRYRQRILLLKRNHISLKSSQKDDDVAHLNEKKKYELQVLDIFQTIYSFGYHVNHEWFLQLEHHHKKMFYYKLEDLWNFRLQLTDTHKLSIIPYIVFTSQEKSSVDRLTPKDLEALLVTRMKELVYAGTTRNHREDGSIYILLALIQVSKPAASSDGLRDLAAALRP